MKSDGIDAWLKHWLTMQKKGRRPLILKDSSNRPSEAHANTHPTVVDRCKGKKPRAEYIESDDDYEVNNVNDSVSDTAGANTNKETDGESLPKSPHSVVATPKSRRTFLGSLSNHQDYKNLLLLLAVAKVRGSLSEYASTNKWIGW
jgi:hypothetical protein